MIKFEDPIDMVAIGIISVIIGIVGGWIKLEREGGNAIIVQKD